LALTSLASVSICGAGHSGSTLLGMILGSLPGAFYIGEGGKVRYLHNPKSPPRKRLCKICGEGCPVWSTFHWNRSASLYPQIAAHVGANLLIDTTKDTDWIASRTDEVRSAGGTAHLIRLLRDGRAVINSRLRKYPDRDAGDEITRWMDQIEKSRRLYESFDGSKMTLHYEALASDPGAAIADVCAFLDRPFDDALLAYYERDHHPLGGNNGTQYAAARRQGRDTDEVFVTIGERSRAFYENDDEVITLDERWKQELDVRHAALFERMAGTFNETLQWGEVDR